SFFSWSAPPSSCPFRLQSDNRIAAQLLRGRVTTLVRLKLAAGLIVLPAVLAIVAAEVALTVSERRPAHVVAGHAIAPFPSENEATVLSLRRRGVAAYPFVAPPHIAFRGYARASEP